MGGDPCGRPRPPASTLSYQHNHLIRYDAFVWQEGHPQGATPLLHTTRVPTHGRVPRLFPFYPVMEKKVKKEPLSLLSERIATNYSFFIFQAYFLASYSVRVLHRPLR